MKIAEIMARMIDFSEGNIHDIDHLIRVWTYAKTIGELEGLDADTQYILEVAAITHDIACPLCREKYGNTNGKHQETEGAVMVRDFLRDTGLTERQVERVAFLVGLIHHRAPQTHYIGVGRAVDGTVGGCFFCHRSNVLSYVGGNSLV